MNHRLLNAAVLLFSALTALSCERPPQEEPAPKSISLSVDSFEAVQEGGTFSLEVTAPSRPYVTDCPDWIAFEVGSFANYKMAVSLVVKPNDTYEIRSSELVVSAQGVTSQKIKVTQAGKIYNPTPPTPSPEDNDAWKVAAWLGLGWNMGNHFDGFFGDWAGEREGVPDEMAWQQQGKATQATFEGVKAAGFTSVRIPVSWLKMIGPGPDYKIDETWMNRVYEVVQYAYNAGLTVIINTHHDENHGANNTYQWQDIKKASDDAAVNTQIKAEIKAVWTQIATKFKDCDDWLIMEGFNELNDGGWGWSADFRANPRKQCNILNEWNQVFVDAVRATGGKNATRWLGVPTYAANPSFEQYFTLPSDPAKKTMLAVHFYDPSDYTIGDEQWSDWGHTGQVGKKSNGGDETHVIEVFSGLCTKYVEKGIPVYWGEFGCSRRAKSDTRAWRFYLYYLEYVVKAAKTYGMPCYLWDNGAEGTGKEQHGYIHHGTGDYVNGSKEIIDVMVRAMTDDDSAYTLQSVYNSAPTF